MNANTNVFLEEFRSTGTTDVLEEEGKQLEIRMVIVNSVRFALQQQPLNGHTELDYREMNRSERWTFVMSGAGKEVEAEVPLPESQPEPVEARGLELPDDFRNQMNVRWGMLVAGSRQPVEAGSRHNAVAVGLTPPLWFVGLPEIQRWLTAEEVYKVSGRETVENMVTDDPEPGDMYVEREDISLDLDLRIVSATRLATEEGEGYTIQWRVTGMKSARDYPDPRRGINRVDATGRSQGEARFDESGVLISLSGTGTSRWDMNANDRWRNPYGEASMEWMSHQEHEISVRRS